MKFLDFLNIVKLKPEMYMGSDKPLRDLELQISGYSAALRLHNFSSDIDKFNPEFSDYVFNKTGWSTSLGWAEAIADHSNSNERAIKKFIELSDNFIAEKYNQ